MESVYDYKWRRLSVAILLCTSSIILLNIPVFGHYTVSTVDVITQFPLYIMILIGWYIGRPLLAVHQWYRNNKKRALPVDYEPSVSVIIPAYNESHGITETVESVFEQTYGGDVEIVITDDGSTDNTWEVIGWLEATYENIRIVQQENAGSGVARNTALENATNEIVLSLDADTVIEPNAIENMVRKFDSDDVVAVGGNVNVRNDDRIVTKTQLFDYSLAFTVGRMFQSRLNHVLCLSGSFSAFRRDVLSGIGGWKTNPKYADDFEISIRMAEQGNINYSQNACANTEAPRTIRGLWKQRTWWARLGVNTMILHWKSNFNPSFGMAGMIGLPLKGALTIGVFYQLFQFASQLIYGGVDVAGVMAATVVFGLVTTTAFSLVMVAIMVLILVNKKPIEHIPYLIIYFTAYRIFHTLARITGLTQAVVREFRDLWGKLPIAR